MSSRNRNNYSKSHGRRSGSATAVRAGSFILFLIAFSFLMGFFVLSRLLPVSREPENQPSVTTSVGDSDPASKSAPEQTASTISPPVPTNRGIPAAPPPTPAAATPGPSIEPADNEATQKPSSIDEPSSTSEESFHRPSAATGNHAGTDSPETNTSDTPRNQDSGRVVSVEPGHSASDTPPAPRRGRRRRRTSPPTEKRSNTDQKPAKEETTQVPGRLDDSSDAATKGDKGDGDN